MTATYTPGPWRPQPNGSIVCPKGGSLAAAWPASLLGHEYPQEANAHLIAAAPELFEAVNAFIVRWDGGARADTDYVAGLMKNALAKARGQAA